jgi:cyclase
VDLDHVDEVVILDVTPEGQGDRENFYRTLRAFTDQCQVPLSVGGKIKDLEEVSRLFGELPVEKVVIERGFDEDPELPAGIAEKWGRQALCEGITKWWGLRGRYTFAPSPYSGEILFQNVEKDGSLQGYDIEQIRMWSSCYKIPVIAGSGCGTWKHMKDAFEAGADACATSCIHHFPPNAIRACKAYLSENGIPVRPAA